MSQREFLNPEPDPRFPSGPWTGFFLQYWLPGRHQTNLDIDFSTGELSGEGRDRVGAYTVAGTYDAATGKCEWIKQYLGKHAVAYRGVADGRGIWGVWEIRLLGGLYTDRGGFHLWPEGTDVSEESDRTEQAVLAAMRAEFGSRPAMLARNLAFVAVAVGLLFLARWGCGY
jgi:hypothetical protein